MSDSGGSSIDGGYFYSPYVPTSNIIDSSNLPMYFGVATKINYNPFKYKMMLVLNEDISNPNFELLLLTEYDEVDEEGFCVFRDEKHKIAQVRGGLFGLIR